MNAGIALAGWGAAAAALGAASAVQRVLGRRMELVARACHEVRGPLTAARLGLHMAGRGPAAGAESLRAIDHELRRAGLALDDLAAARHGGRAADRAEEVEIGRLLREAGAAWRPVARASGGELSVDAPARPTWVRGDRTRLAQACGNLLANALEHGGGRIELRAREDCGRVRIEVLDSGPGLPAPVAELTRRPRRGRGRRGRGLAIAAEIAARHGGTLACAPSPRGARLALELPAARVAP